MNIPLPDRNCPNQRNTARSTAARRSALAAAVVVSLSWHPANAMADDVSAADAALFAGDYQIAIEGYDQLASPSANSIYNHGVALYRSSQFGPAAEKFRQVLAASNDELAARARFNLGNTLYASALAQLKENPAEGDASKETVEQVLQDLRSAILQYRSALRIHSSDTDARANIELAQRLIDQIEKQQQEQQQQEQQQQDQQQQDQQQQGQQQQDQQQQDQQQQDQQQMPRQSRERTGDGGDPELDETTPAESQNEETPQGELRAANEQEEGIPQDATEEVGVEMTDRMTEEEARKMLQAIRDRDMLRRLRRQAAERSRRIPVERDW